jgi:hypothetical protein
MRYEVQINRIREQLINFRLISLFLLALVFSGSVLQAQSMQIQRIDLFTKNNVLFSRLHVQNFFDEGLTESIASGMSRRIEIQLELVRNDRKSYFNRIESLNLKYDVWERIYLYKSASTQRQFDNFENFKHFVSDSMQFRLSSLTQLNQDEQYQLYVIFSQVEITETQQKELKSWIARDAQTSESQPAQETDQGFSINISRLLSLFFSGKSSDDFYVYKSPFFTLKSLDDYENTAQ